MHIHRLYRRYPQVTHTVTHRLRTGLRTGYTHASFGGGESDVRHPYGTRMAPVWHPYGTRMAGVCGREYAQLSYAHAYVCARVMRAYVCIRRRV